jgi:hypothetical protein
MWNFDGASKGKSGVHIVNAGNAVHQSSSQSSATVKSVTRSTFVLAFSAVVNRKTSVPARPVRMSLPGPPSSVF